MRTATATLEKNSCVQLLTPYTIRYLAVAERSFHELGTVSIYDVLTTRKLTSCTYPDCDTKEWVSLAFSSENQFLLTQGGTSPSGKDDWTLVYWAWDKGRAMAGAKISKHGIVNRKTEEQKTQEGEGDGDKKEKAAHDEVAAILGDESKEAETIHECSFNPADSSVAVVIGDGIFKFLKYLDGSFKEIPTRLQKIRKPQVLPESKRFLVSPDESSVAAFMKSPCFPHPRTEVPNAQLFVSL